jgi:hypothetical protein
MNKNNNNNNKLRTKINNKGPKRKKTYMGKLSVLHPYSFDFYQTASMDTGLNFSYDIIGQLSTTALFTHQAQYFQEFKLVYIEILVTPVKVNGTPPSVGYCLFLANETLNVAYSQLPYVQGNIRINPEGVTNLKFYSWGRNSDTNRWYNTQSLDSYNDKCQVYAYFKFLDALDTQAGPHYTMQVRCRILFRRPTTTVTNKQSEDVKNINVEGCDLKETQDLNSGTTSQDEVVISVNPCK